MSGAWHICLVLAAACAGAEAAEKAKYSWRDVFSHDYSVQIGGAVAGTMRLRHYVEESDPSLFRTIERMNATVVRGDDVVQMTFVSEVVENAEGVVVSAGYDQKMAQSTIRMRYAYPESESEEQVAVITSTQNGQKRTSTAPLTEAPSGKLRMLRAFRDAVNSNTPVDSTLNLKVVKPEAGPTNSAIVATLQSNGPELVRGLLGNEETTVEVSKWSVVVENVGLTSSEWYHFTDDDREGVPGVVMVYYEVDSPMGKLVAVLDSASGAAEQFRTESKRPELVHSTYVPLARPYNELWKGSGRVVYHVTTKTGATPSIPEAGFQRVSGEGTTKKVVVDMSDPTPLLEEESIDVYLESSAMLDASDEAIKALAKKAKADAISRGAEPTDTEALTVSAWMITKQTITGSDLATGFASASETARTRTGDCSENAVLLAAILRALGIPSRTCAGLVYLHTREGANFGWHMWSQALLHSKDGSLVWKDVDATLPTPFTLGHILLGTSSMSDAEAHSSELRLVNLIGNLQVEVRLDGEEEGEL